MAETSKYDFFMDELSSLEKQLYTFVQKSFELTDKNSKIEKKMQQLEKENDVLKMKIREIENKLNNSLFNDNSLFNNDSLKLEDRELIKSKISELISKIEYHLRS
ncbi:MAG: hypothetical protein A2V66_08060 [Ignavibacteria bacterium RBG_13_36_8]|nr:MAG: hypothetical protein A2V66_08060 [Ignavibacteria bacterium RBG_13_36_8]